MQEKRFQDEEPRVRPSGSRDEYKDRSNIPSPPCSAKDYRGFFSLCSTIEYLANGAVACPQYSSLASSSQDQSSRIFFTIWLKNAAISHFYCVFVIKMADSAIIYAIFNKKLRNAGESFCISKFIRKFLIESLTIHCFLGKFRPSSI